MAQIEKFNSPNVDPDDEIINLSNTVGIAGGGVKPANAAGDVMVVQALLDLVTFARPRFTTVSIRVDGIFSPNTGRAILDYQDMIRKRGNQGRVPFWVSKDGRVAPARSGTSLLSRQEWTIIALNTNPAMLIAAGLGFNSQIEAIIARHPLIVPHLRRAF